MKKSLPYLALLLVACTSGGGGGYRFYDLAINNGSDGGANDDLGGGGTPDFAGSKPDFSILPPSCNDQLKNGSETDVDCGGGGCEPCGNQRSCRFGTDCLSGVCTNQVCQAAPSCNDQLKNGSETDVDCGGLDCNACADGKKCIGSDDCTNFNCSNGLCCGQGRANCDGLSGNGCENILASDAKNCGSCGNACALNQTCVNSICQGGQGGYHWVLVEAAACDAWCGGQGGNFACSNGPYTCDQAHLGGHAWIYSASQVPPPVSIVANAYGWVSWYCSANKCGGPGPNEGVCADPTSNKNTVWKCVFN